MYKDAVELLRKNHSELLQRCNRLIVLINDSENDTYSIFNIIDKINKLRSKMVEIENVIEILGERI